MYSRNERKEMCTAEMREKERKSKNKSTGNDYAVAASLSGRESCTLPYGPFLRDTVVLHLRNARTYNFRAKIERNEFTTETTSAYNLTAGCGDEGKRNFRGPKRQLFQQNEGLFKAPTESLVSQLHAREKWRRCGHHNYQK